MGVRVRAKNVEKETAMDRVIPNSRKSRPVLPVIKASGTKTAIRTTVVLRTAKLTRFIPLKAAVFGSSPSSMPR